MRFIYSKIFAWFAVALIIAVIAMVLQTKGWLGYVQRLFLYAPRPVVQVSKGIAFPVKNFFKNIYSLKKVVKENAELKAYVATLQQQVADLHHYKTQAENLEKELGFVRQGMYSLEPCTVLAQDPENVTNTIVLSCGSVRGVKSGQGIVAGGYLIGQVFVVNSTTSTARLLIHPDLGVDAKVSGTDVSGLIKGSFGSGVFMDLISQNATLNPRDLVVTAGLNELIPKNLLIGQVGDVVSAPNDLFKKVTIQSPVDFKNLHYVFVVK